MLNKSWHQSNRMPKNPTPEQRLKWHLAHAKNCNCRELTKEMVESLKSKVKSIK